MDNRRSNVYIMPAVTLIGQGCLNDLGIKMQELKAGKALIVTDKFMCKSGTAEKISAVVAGKGIKTSVYDGVLANPTIKVVNEAFNMFLEEECDSIISLGGGSAHDTAKAVKLTLLEGGFIRNTNVPFAAVNTTAGTASEMTRYCVITDEDKHCKMAIVHKDVVPDIAADDPELMTGMPHSLTAATGMDALTHAIEAYTAVGHNELTDCTAIKAVELIFRSLYTCYKNGQDIQAREDMVYAEYMAGMSFSNAGLGLVHAMSHQLSGLYNLPHGVCNAVLLPYVMEFNLDTNYKRYSAIAKKTGLSVQGLPDMLCANNLIKNIKNLNIKLGIPKTIKELNVKQDDFEKLADMAMNDSSYPANAKPSKKEDLIAIYENAYSGGQRHKASLNSTL